MATPLIFSLLIWAIVTAALIAVATYRSFLSRNENGRIILSKGDSQLLAQQKQVISKVSRLDGFVKGLAVACGSLLVVCAAVWIWSSLANL